LHSFLKVVPSDPKEKWSGFTSHFTLTNMKGSFSTKISDAVKSMQPIPIPLPLGLVDGDTQLLAGSPETPIYNGSILNSASDSAALDIDQPTPALQFPTQTSSELDPERFELRKRLGVAAAAAAPAAVVAAVDPHTIPYGEQTGLTKYAPMPKMAGTTILDKSPTPQYPPFPFVKATTYLPAPTVQWTDTAYLTFTTHSIENTVCCPPRHYTEKQSMLIRLFFFFRLHQPLRRRWIRECSDGWNGGRTRNIAIKVVHHFLSVASASASVSYFFPCFLYTAFD
jgi:hypothetical protein